MIFRVRCHGRNSRSSPERRCSIWGRGCYKYFAPTALRKPTTRYQCCAVRTETVTVTVIRIILGVALIATLFAAGWNVYRRLPTDSSQGRPETYNTNANSELTIVFHSEAATAINTHVDLYPIDFASMQRDFFSAVRPGKTFDDFLAQRMKGLEPVRAPLDDKGRAVAKLSEGNWWLRATTALASGEQIEWRLPINVSGRAQTIELTMENAYERTKKF